MLQCRPTNAYFLVYLSKYLKIVTSLISLSGIIPQYKTNGAIILRPRVYPILNRDILGLELVINTVAGVKSY